jgi:glycosyltransferase involved in cell wall biosynthesis
MKIAVLAPYWNPPSFRGGVSRVIYELRKIWVKKGHTIDIFASTATSDPHNGIFKLPCPPIPYRTVLNNFLLSRHDVLAKYDIIFPQSAIACIFLPREKTVPFIHTLSDIEHKSPLRPWRHGHRVLERRALKGILKCFTLDSRTNQSLVSRCGMRASNILHISNGVDHHKFSPSPVKRRNCFKIISAGRFVPRKHFDKLIRIFAEFLKLRNGAILQIAGDGVLRNDLVSLTRKLGIEDSVQFLGQLQEDELIRGFRHASVFMFTSGAEGMPMVLLEAQSCGLPVITSAFESARSLVEDKLTGFIIDDCTLQPWLNALTLIHDDANLRTTLSRKARERVLDLFTWEKTSRTILTCFHDVLATGEADDAHSTHE